METPANPDWTCSAFILEYTLTERRSDCLAATLPNVGPVATNVTLNSSWSVRADGRRCRTTTSRGASPLKVSAGFTHLIEEKLPPLLFPEVHLLHGHLLAAVLLAGDAHDARGAFADFNEAVQVFPRVA